MNDKSPTLNKRAEFICRLIYNEKLTDWNNLYHYLKYLEIYQPFDYLTDLVMFYFEARHQHYKFIYHITVSFYDYYADNNLGTMLYNEERLLFSHKEIDFEYYKLLPYSKFDNDFYYQGSNYMRRVKQSWKVCLRDEMVPEYYLNKIREIIVNDLLTI